MKSAQAGIEAPVPPQGRYLYRVIESFRHGRGANGHGRDLTGDEGRTENPQDVTAEKAGLDDGITDALFRISKPVSGAYFWCPPVRVGAQGLRLDLRQIGL
jgi:hypothetical protein